MIWLTLLPAFEAIFACGSMVCANLQCAIFSRCARKNSTTKKKNNALAKGKKPGA
jgi:hypothetical protein